MKKFKKLIALACVATMVISPMTALADTSGETTPSTGDSVIENDNSEKPNYTAVVLPTINAGTYDFKIDRDKLLDEYDYVNTYDAASHIYFKAQSDPATLEAKADGSSLYVRKTVATNDDAAAFLALFETSDSLADDEVLAALAGYYVWVPTDADPTLGEFEAISADNITSIVKWDAEADVAVLCEDYNSGAFIWDGTIYYDTYNKLNATEAVEYITVENGVVTAVSADLYVATGTADTVLVAAVTKATTDTIKYTAPTTQFINESDAAKVVNKSTTPVLVTVQVNMSSDDGLTYVGADEITTDVENASVYFAIKDENGNTATVEDSAATAYYVLAGANNPTTTYRGTTTDPLTGSYNYFQYENPNPIYAEHSFTIVADVNENEAADAAWDEYIEALKASDTPIKPVIQVVYSWEVVEATENENEYVDLAGENTYTTDGSTGWVADHIAKEEPFEASHTFSLNGDGSKYYFTPDPTGEVTSAKAYIASDYANSENPTLKADLANKIEVAGSGNVAILKTSLEGLLTVAGDYAIEIIVGDVTYTFAYTVPAKAFKASHELSLNGDSTKYYFTPNPIGDVTSAKAYIASDYANSEEPTLKADLADKIVVANSGNVTILKTALEEVLTVAGDYAIEIIVNGVTYTFAYTVSE